MKIRLDQEACSGHGRCYILAPEVFGEDERGHCVLKMEEVPEDLHANARSAVDNCPEQALTIEKPATA